MPHRIDAEMEAVQAAGFEPVLDRVLSQAEPEKLTPGHHPVLPSRQSRDRLIIAGWLLASLSQSAYIAG